LPAALTRMSGLKATSMIESCGGGSVVHLDDFVSCLEAAVWFDSIQVYRMSSLETLPTGMVAVGGFYSDEEGIELALYVDQNTDEIDESMHSIEDLVEEVKLTLLHESVHRNQSSIRSYSDGYRQKRVNMSDPVQYLGHYDEIDAYGRVDLAVFVQKDGWEAAFRDPLSILSRYIKTFGKDSKVVKKVIKKAYLSDVGKKWKIA